MNVNKRCTHKHDEVDYIVNDYEDDGNSNKTEKLFRLIRFDVWNAGQNTKEQQRDQE